MLEVNANYCQCDKSSNYQAKYGMLEEYISSLILS